MLFIVAQTYGITTMKGVLLSIQLAVVFCYTPKKFLNDLQFMTRRKIFFSTKISLFIFLPLGLLAAGIEMWTFLDLFSFVGKRLPTWAIGNY